MLWFGESWGAPVCEAGEHIDRPSGRCTSCGVAFANGDRGVALSTFGLQAYHHGCFLWLLGLLHIHVLSAGRPLCGFHDDVPAAWPKDHKWCHRADWQQATCPRCRHLAAPADGRTE